MGLPNLSINPQQMAYSADSSLSSSPCSIKKYQVPISRVKEERNDPIYIT